MRTPLKAYCAMRVENGTIGNVINVQIRFAQPPRDLDYNRLPIPGIKQERIGASAVILSPIASQERPQYRGLEEVTKEEDTYLRIFGKPFTRVNRRMGVVLCYAPLDSDLDALRDKAKRIAEKVEVH